MNYTFVSKYARWTSDKKRRETWAEAVDRVKTMMLEKYASFDIQDQIEWAYDRMHKKLVLGSQRALQFGGSPISKHNARIYNCITSYADRLKFFQECMYLLLCGCGTGFSVQHHHIAKLPKLVKQKSGSKKFVISDSIEGWSDAVGALVSSYFVQKKLFPEYNAKHVSFDYSQIRPAGSSLQSSGGKAPGPEPLKNALTQIKRILDKALKRIETTTSGTQKLLPIEIGRFMEVLK